MIKSLKTSNSKSPQKIIKASVHLISPPLGYICNQYLSTGIFPSHLKYSVLKPVFKNGIKKVSQIIHQYHFLLLNKDFQNSNKY